MDDPRVANLVVQFLRERYFDCELDAWRAARRLVLEIDLMAAEADDPHRLPQLDMAAASSTRSSDGRS
jgi:hypothetical protein